MPVHEAPHFGLLLVGHGTRSATGRAETLQLADLVADQLSGVPVEAGFLELTEPTIAECVAKLAEQGVRHVVVMPLLLFAAGHAKRDIPDAVEKAAESCLNLSITYLPHFGCQPEIVELSAQRFREAASASQAETALVLVGRGSHDAEATAEMHRFTRLRTERTPVGKAVTCFLAMAEPRLEATLEEIAAQGWRRIIVQPHLLFHGDLLERLRGEVDSARARWPDRAWLIAERLGPAPQLASLIAAQFRERSVDTSQ